MLQNPFISYFEVVNDIEDFKLPYRYRSKTDTEVMLRKYYGLSNKAKSNLSVRLHNGQTIF